MLRNTGKTFRRVRFTRAGRWVAWPLVVCFEAFARAVSWLDRRVFLPLLRSIRQPFRAIGEKHDKIRGYSGLLEGFIAVFLLLGIGYDAPKAVFEVFKNAGRDLVCGISSPFSFHNWCGATGEHLSSWSGLGWAIAGFLAFIFVSRWLLAISGDYKLSYANVVEAKKSKARVLVMALSYVKESAARAEADRFSATAPERERFVSTVAEFYRKATTEEDLRPGPWQQSARMIAHHLPKLEAIYVLPSDESLDCFPLFVDYCKRFFGTPLPFTLHRVDNDEDEAFSVLNDDRTKIRNYDSYDFDYQGLIQAIRLAKRAIPDLTDREICLDTTAGSKTISIAGAMVALNEDLRLGYVTSALPGNRILGGEVIIYQPKAVSIADLGEISQQIGR